MPGRGGNSELWLHFEKDDSGKASCNICKEKISYKSTTANLKSHLKRKHVSIFSSAFSSQTPPPPLLLQTNPSLPGPSNIPATVPSTQGPVESTDESGTGRTKRQRLMAEFTHKKISAEQKKQINLDLLDLCTDSFHPFSIVEEKAFKKYSRWIPGYELPTRKTLSNSIMQQAYTKTFDFVQNQLKNDVRSICLTADMWTSLKTESYIALTGHYLTDNLEFKTVLLGCCHFSGHHTSENIATEIRTLVEKFELKEKVNFMVTDNASNIVRAVKDILNWKNFGCYAHTLNLIVENALKLVEDDIAKVKRIVAHVKKSTLSSERLQKYQIQQGNEPKRLSQAVDTRWNSTYYMLKRFVELEEAIRATLAFTDSRLPIITTEDWTLYSQLCQILRPFEEITKSMSGEKYVSGSSVIVVTRCLKEACEKIICRTDLLSAVTDVALTLRSGLIDRFGIIEQSGTFSLCTFMDPRFKTQGFCDQNEANKTKERVRKMVAALIAKTTDTTPSTVLTVTDDSNKSNEDLNPWNIFDQMIASTTTQGTPLSKAIKEVDMYLADDLLPRKDQLGNLNCPLEWWKNHEFVYPHLKQIFVTHCNIVATSVPCERMFSKTGLIINQRRTRLTTSKVEQIMFLNVNSPKDRFKGYE